MESTTIDFNEVHVSNSAMGKSYPLPGLLNFYKELGDYKVVLITVLLATCRISYFYI